MSKEEKTVQKPLILEMRDAKLDIVNCINNSITNRHLPAYILRGIVEEVLNSLKEVERQEMENAEAQYTEALKEPQK